MKKLIMVLVVVGICSFALIYCQNSPKSGHTVQSRLDQFGSAVDKRLKPKFAKAGLKYPPKQISFVAFKDARVVHVYAKDSTSEGFVWVTKYPVQAASGVLGPKLKEGDRQVPEGIYAASFLNPNSRYHVSIRVNYPNKFDQKVAKLDKRTNLGGDIMIHGKASSIGCLAMGDIAAEDLFALTAKVGLSKTKIVIAPVDFRTDKRSDDQILPKPQQNWIPELYANIREELKKYPVN